MKLRKKLFLSCAALAACATTLASTTYAWYTSNAKVTVDELTGSTSAEITESSIYVAPVATYDTDGLTPKTWGSYGASATAKLTVSTAVKFEPVHWDSTAMTYKKLTGSGEDKKTATYAETEVKADVLEFVLRFKTTSTELQAALPVYVSNFEVTSEGDSAAPALAWGDNTGVGTTGNYDADILKALKMHVTATDIVAQTGVARTASPVLYDLSAFATKDDLNLAVTETADALGYYNAVTGSTLTRPSGYTVNSGTAIEVGEANASGAVSLFSIPTSGIVEVRFVFWLDGWDDYCYDIMRGQTVNITLGFSAAAGDNVLFEVE